MVAQQEHKQRHPQHDDQEYPGNHGPANNHATRGMQGLRTVLKKC